MNPDLLCRRLIGRHLARRKYDFDEQSRSRGIYGFSLEEHAAFSKPYQAKRSKLKEYMLRRHGLKGSRFERLWQEVAKRPEEWS